MCGNAHLCMTIRASEPYAVVEQEDCRNRQPARLDSLVQLNSRLLEYVGLQHLYLRSLAPSRLKESRTDKCVKFWEEGAKKPLPTRKEVCGRYCPYDQLPKARQVESAVPINGSFSSYGIFQKGAIVPSAEVFGRKKRR